MAIRVMRGGDDAGRAGDEANVVMMKLAGKAMRMKWVAMVMMMVMALAAIVMMAMMWVVMIRVGQGDDVSSETVSLDMRGW